MVEQVLSRCQNVFPAWRGLTVADFSFADPKGFSSFTMAIEAKQAVEPSAILYRHLEGKENAILDFEREKRVFLLLGDHQIAAHCHHYDDVCRMEAFYNGRTLTRHDLTDPDTLRKIADQLWRFHQLTPDWLPKQSFFELLHTQWGAMAYDVLVNQRDHFPRNEQVMCDLLREIYAPETLAKVMAFMPDEELTFCHNDTYHGNIMKLTDGTIKLLDFEFSCLNHKAFDFANLFAETVMRHKQPDYPYFRVAEAEYTDTDIERLVGYYLTNATFASDGEREAELQRLVQATKRMIPLSDFMYAMAALPLAVEPIQKIRFIPYAYARFGRFQKAYEQQFGR